MKIDIDYICLIAKPFLIRLKIGTKHFANNFASFVKKTFSRLKDANHETINREIIFY